MSRPKKLKIVNGLPEHRLYGPINASNKNSILMSIEEYETITKIRDMTPDKKLELAENVKQSVKNSGAEDLARYIVDIYNNINITKSNKEK